ncbi:ABC-type branched-chain amino acid transport systems, ATPase component [Yersinia enterocolitica subsp. palearctica 105.5R(r)]|nr:branched-chain amino acid ABC transporter ATPase [Yersinia enterocolitica]ADZ41190.1 ABC-type branched-chain amino acid transport systems, ATPase component [Yersinia enterocolitica subsp. palearctica 105.5R(r)]
MNNVVLQIEGLTGGYGGGQVLNGVTLQLHAAEVLGLIGRNGVGKNHLNAYLDWRSSGETRPHFVGRN